MTRTTMSGRYTIVSRLNYAHWAKVLEARNAPLSLRDSLPKGEG